MQLLRIFSTILDLIALIAEVKPKEGIVGIVDEVYDSSRYFALRIKVSKSMTCRCFTSDIVADERII
jgi:hypothetical protein